MIMVLVILHLRYVIVGTRFQKDFSVKIHGRWKSGSAKDMYIEESLENRSHVTKYSVRFVTYYRVSEYSSISENCKKK